MAVNYASRLPQDENNAVMTHSSTPFPALQTDARDNATVSSVTAFNVGTTTIEVTAVGGTGFIKWAPTQATSVVSAAGTANFDNAIPANATRIFVVPRNTEALGRASVGSYTGTNVDEGLYPAVATKGIASVLVTQY